MSKGGSSAPASQTVTNKTQLPGWVEQAGQDVWNTAKTTADGLQAPYSGPIVTDANSDMRGAWDMARTGGTMAQPAFQTAGATMGNEQQLFAGQNISGDINKFLNPQIENIENRALDALERQRQTAINGVGDQAIAAKAFGGSRHGIMEGVTNAESARAAGDLSATLRGQAFDRATGLAMDSSKLRQAAALGGAQIGANQQQSWLQGAAAREAAGNASRGIDMQMLADKARMADVGRSLPIEKLSILQSAIGSIPYNKTSTATGPSNYQPANPWLGALGGAATGASIASTLGATGAMGGWGGAMGAGAGALLGLLSDRDEKTDIEKVGKDPETGEMLYAFRYKNDPKSYPKVVGPMAQDVEKAKPGSTRKIGGKRVITNLGFGGG